MLCGFIVATASSQNSDPVLTLPEITVTSFRNTLGTGKTVDSGTSDKHTPPPPGHAFQPLRLQPGTRLDVAHMPTSHALISFGAVGGCMITEGSSLRLPDTGEKGMTVTFDRHISSSPNRMFLNIQAAEMAKHGGAVFRTKNKYQTNSSPGAVPMPNLVFSTRGGRFFILDGPGIQSTPSGPSVNCCTVGVFDGSASVVELTSKQQTEVKAGQVVVLTPEGISAPRAPTKAEMSYDLGCKLAVLGREAPARLPDSMKTKPAMLPTTRTNSLGMVFVPLPGTQALMCVHETRHQDFAPYAASAPQVPDGRPRAYAYGLWGWDDHPVTTSWEEAQAFCAWLSQKEGKKYRLPTDQEWSQAVGIGSLEKRGPNTTPAELAEKRAGDHPWGPSWPPPPSIGNLGDVSYHAEHPLYHSDGLANYDDGFAGTAPVMSFKPNKLGLYDLAGNVGEWCEDWYDNARTKRVVRGGRGPGTYLQTELRSSFRHALSANNVLNAGFRIVQELP